MRHYSLKSILFIVSLLFSFSLPARTIPVGVEEIHETGFTSYVNIRVEGALIVLGDLVMNEKVSLTIATGGVVIVTGDLSIGKNVNVSALGYLVSGSFTAPGKWGEKFNVGKNVYINSVTVLGNKMNNLSVLTDEGHYEIPELEFNNPAIWEYFQKVSGGATGGTIEIVGSSNSCFGTSLPSIVNKTEAWPNAYSQYSWEYSPDQSNWIITGSQTIDMGLPEPTLSVGTYYFRRKVLKKGTLEEKFSNTLVVTLNPIPAPIGIFYN